MIPFFQFLVAQTPSASAVPSTGDSIPTWVGFILTTATMFVIVGVHWGLQKSQIREVSEKHEKLHKETADFKVDHEKRLALLAQSAAAQEVKMDQVSRELGTKASTESVQEIKTQLSKIDAKLDALLISRQKED